MKRFLLLISAMLFSLNIMAQLEVKKDSFKEVGGFVNINTDIQYDDNDKPYAVLKVKTENINDEQRRKLLFQGDARTFIECEYKVGEVWLYISYYASYIKISHPDYGSTEFWFPFDMNGKKGYELILVNKPIVDQEIVERIERLENASTGVGNNNFEYYGYKIKESEFIGTVVAIKTDSTYLSTTKAFGELRSGTSWKYNSWNAISLYIDGNSSECKLQSGINKFIVKVSNNNNDPNAIFTILRFDKKGNKRMAVLSLDNSGTLMASKTISDYKVMFDGMKYGESSYIIQANLKPGEYGIVITQANGEIKNHPIVNCFTVLR